MQQPNRYSPVKTAIWEMSRGHEIEDDIEFGVCQPKSSYAECRGLATGEESYYTTMLCDYVVDRLRREENALPEQQRRPINLHQLVYIVSRMAEKHIGADVSFGQYDSIFRVRLMQKALHRHWCDQPWSFRVSFSRTGLKKKTGDYGHLLTLLRLYTEHANIRPYLLINVSFCVHDYRRFDAPYSTEPGGKVPGLESLLRTFVLDLGAITKLEGYPEIINHPTFSLDIDKKADVWGDENYPAHHSLDSGAAKAQFTATISYTPAGSKPVVIPLEQAHFKTLSELYDAIRETLGWNWRLAAIAQARQMSVIELAKVYKDQVLARDWDGLA